MGSAVSPERWHRFFELYRAGFGKSAAAKAAGISLPTIRAGLRGDPTSSIHRYRQWRDAQKPCPTCHRVG